MKSWYSASDVKDRLSDELVFQVALLPDVMTGGNTSSGSLSSTTSLVSVYSLPSKVAVAV